MMETDWIPLVGFVFVLLILGVMLLLVLAGLVAFLRERLRWPIARRQDAPEGRMITLSRGRTHVTEHGHPDGVTVVFVHGLTTPSFVFGAQVEALVARGHHVITYDHYGRGLSDRPKGLQTGAFFRSHLRELLSKLGIDGPVVLVGYSMGGAIVADYAAAFPTQVTSLILLAPAGMRAGLGGWAQRLAFVPVIGDVFFHLSYPRLHRKGVEAERDLPSAVPCITDRQLEEQRYRGYFGAVLSSLRGVLRHSLAPEHRRIAQHSLAVTAVWGAEDDIIPLSGKQTLAQWNPSATHVVVAGAGHGLVYTHADAVSAAIFDAIGAPDRPSD